jgi:hypothetical protein
VAAAGFYECVPMHEAAPPLRQAAEAQETPSGDKAASAGAVDGTACADAPCTPQPLVLQLDPGLVSYKELFLVLWGVLQRRVLALPSRVEAQQGGAGSGLQAVGQVAWEPQWRLQAEERMMLRQFCGELGIFWSVRICEHTLLIVLGPHSGCCTFCFMASVAAMVFLPCSEVVQRGGTGDAHCGLGLLSCSWGRYTRP